MSTADEGILQLKPREERRLKKGHLWIYSNEVDTDKTPLKLLEPGQDVVVLAANGKPVGRALANPGTLICARLYSRDPRQKLTAELLRERMERALALRERIYPGTGCYRMVYGEADGLSGVIIDRYRDYLVCQLTTAGMERRRDMVVDALRRVVAPRGIVFKNDVQARDAETLDKYVEVVGNTPPERLALEENGVEFVAPVLDGQKTGWFYDHRENRARACGLAGGGRVLDAFSYVGGWGLQALARGARELLAVDASAAALDVLDDNAQRQGVSDRVTTTRGNAFDVLAELADGGERFDLVVIDPPALIKRRKDLRAGERAYQKLATLGMRLAAPDGMLLFGSCSLHYSRDMLQDALRASSRHVERQAQMLGLWGLAPDHPMHPAIRESDYLKAALVRVGPPGRGGAI